jgi:hypothetical protein
MRGEVPRHWAASTQTQRIEGQPARRSLMGSSSIRVVRPVAGYATVCGILGLIATILGWIVPMVGVLFITPVAILLTALALYGGSKGLGIASVILIILNLAVSPTFWLNVATGATQEAAAGNRLLSWFDVIGVGVLLVLAARRRTMAAADPRMGPVEA